MAKVLITGGTGMIGSRLSTLLEREEHEVVILSRNPEERPGVFAWDIGKRWVDPAAFEGVEFIVHLAGAGMADQSWTEARKREIINSRVQTAEILAEQCKANKVQLKGFLSASAIGYYPLNNELPPQTEEAAPGQSFQSEVCLKWEAAADRFGEIADFVSKVRIGLVLTNEGGALSRLATPVKYYVGAGIGSGHQSMPWIHIDDVCNVFIHLLSNELGGTYNAVGPEIADNNTFMQTLADIMERPLLFTNIPEFLVRIAAGDMADLVLKGAPVSSKKLQKTGFHFDYPTLNTALSDLLLKRSF